MMQIEALLDEKRDAIRDLCRRYGVRQLDLFGSAAEGDFEPGRSDLDFLVVFERCSPSEHYERYFGLVEGLESLLGLHVDLVEANAMRNPYFIRSVNSSKRLVYAG